MRGPGAYQLSGVDCTCIYISKVTLEENFRNGYAYFPNLFENVGRIEMRFRRKGRKETVVIKQVRMPVLPEDCRDD